MAEPTDYKYCPLCAHLLELKQRNTQDTARLTCPDCGFVHYDNPAPAVIAVAKQDSAYLIVKRASEPNSGKWDLPGGFIERSEHPIDTIKREIMEETGLEVVELRLLDIYQNTNYGGKHVVDAAYECEVTGDVMLSDENSEYRWVNLDDVPELAFDSANAVIADLRKKAARG